jgi:Zn-dependent protease with chaperone function
MSKNLLSWITTLGFIAACSTVPYTGRRQLMLVPESNEIASGEQAYRQISRDSVMTDNSEAMRIVRRVGERIARAANKPDYRWEFRIINDPDNVNAFCVPGGKVAVYTGIFPIAKDEGGLAVILGHEVAHALLRHAGERMSQAEVLGTGLVFAGASGVNPQILQALGLGASVGVILPFSRSQESEADHVGLILMAKAGYDPRVSLEVWQRMERKEKGAPPEFLSTHPGSETRIQQLRAWMPEALQYYQSGNQSVELLPSPQVLDSPTAKNERELLKKIQVINQYVEQKSGERPIVEALAYELRLNPQIVIQERQQLRIGYGQYAALRGVSYLGHSSINRILSVYQRGEPWSEIAQANGTGLNQLTVWLNEVIRTTNNVARQPRYQQYRPSARIR